MANVARLFNERVEAAGAEDYLGPARVTEAGAGGLRVELEDGAPVTATLALAFPYEPTAGDVVLVIGKRDRHYVIGVLHGTGRSVLAMQGDVELRAVNGVLTVAGDKGVQIEGPELEVSVGKLKMVAESVVQKFTNVYQHVKALLSVRAGETHTLVDDATFAKSKTATILTEEKMAINGKEIHLG
jgi:hypothetical protein